MQSDKTHLCERGKGTRTVIYRVTCLFGGGATPFAMFYSYKREKKRDGGESNKYLSGAQARRRQRQWQQWWQWRQWQWQTPCRKTQHARALPTATAPPQSARRLSCLIFLSLFSRSRARDFPRTCVSPGNSPVF